MMSAQPIRQILSVASILASLLATSAAWAQNADAESDDGGLQEIVVTAQKRAENLQEVPIAVTAVGGEAIAASGVADTRELAALIPGLAIRTTTGSFQPAIRGIGTSSSVVENPVSLDIDGVYYPQQREGLRELNDIERLEKLAITNKD
jgi:iron complex outermembrane receptor protein